MGFWDDVGNIFTGKSQTQEAETKTIAAITADKIKAIQEAGAIPYETFRQQIDGGFSVNSTSGLNDVFVNIAKAAGTYVEPKTGVVGSVSAGSELERIVPILKAYQQQINVLQAAAGQTQTQFGDLLLSGGGIVAAASSGPVGIAVGAITAIGSLFLSKQPDPVIVAVGKYLTDNYSLFYARYGELTQQQQQQQKAKLANENTQKNNALVLAALGVGAVLLITKKKKKK